MAALRGSAVVAVTTSEYIMVTYLRTCFYVKILMVS